MNSLVPVTCYDREAVFIIIEKDEMKKLRFFSEKQYGKKRIGKDRLSSSIFHYNHSMNGLCKSFNFSWYETQYYTFPNLIDAMLKLKEQKEGFFKKKVKIKNYYSNFKYNRNRAEYSQNKEYYEIKMKEQFYILMKQLKLLSKKDFDRLDIMFLETEFNKEKRKQDIDDLFNKCVGWYDGADQK